MVGLPVNEIGVDGWKGVVAADAGLTVVMARLQAEDAIKAAIADWKKKNEEESGVTV